MFINCCKNDTLLEATPKMKNCVSTAPARADRGSDPLENHTKSKENETFEPTRQKVQQKGALWDIFGTILMAKTAQARDKTGLWSHSAPDSRKHDFLRGQGAKHCKTRVLGRSRSEPGGGGAALWGLGKTTIWHLKVMFYEGFRYFCERSVGAGP